MQALREMKDAYPTGRFWIKGDGCDVKQALQQSVKGVWNGDADLGDGNLQELRTDYEERMKDIKNLVSPQDNVERVLVDLDKVAANLDTDKKFLTEGLIKATKTYADKCKAPNPSKKVLMELSWERVEYSELVQQCQSLQSYVKTSKASVGQHNQVLHVQKSMVEKKSDWEQYLRNLFIKRRQPAATHVFIFLLSDECRNKKPYCLPIQYLPYHSLKDQDVRELTKNIRQEMAKLGMLAIGLYNYIIMFII
jgi:DNA gyrase/topoisomerase IV subunit A